MQCNWDHYKKLFVENFTKIVWKLKKAFCSNFFPWQVFGKNWPLIFPFSQVTSVQKRESRKPFLGSLFSTLVTLEKLKSDEEKFYFRRDMEKNRNKILLFIEKQIPLNVEFVIIFLVLGITMFMKKPSQSHAKFVG